MSRSQLKKEISTLDRNQLEQMVLDAYAAKKEIKEYFDFFLHPDVEKLTERYKIAVSKELSRSKWGHSKARITAIKKLVKDFEGYQPGFDKEIELQLFIVAYALVAESQLYFSDTLRNGISALMLRMVHTADRNLVADKILPQLTAMLDNNDAGTPHFRRHLRNALQSEQF